LRVSLSGDGTAMLVGTGFDESIGVVRESRTGGDGTDADVLACPRTRRGLNPVIA
jgi:hypothetical protein